jgi:hypothetical protein
LPGTRETCSNRDTAAAAAAAQRARARKREYKQATGTYADESGAGRRDIGCWEVGAAMPVLRIQRPQILWGRATTTHPESDDGES